MNKNGYIKVHTCVICDCRVAGRKLPLEGRRARCPYCKKTEKSSYDLAFFQSRPGEEFDEYYDGCFGWE